MAIPSHRFKDSADSLLLFFIVFFRHSELFMDWNWSALCFFKLENPRGFFLWLKTNVFDLGWSPGWYWGVLFEELSPALSERSNLLNLAVDAVSAAAQVGQWVERSELTSFLNLFWERLREWPVGIKRRKSAVHRVLPRFILFMVALAVCHHSLRINNERFREQLRQVQTNLMSLRQKRYCHGQGGG